MLHGAALPETIIFICHFPGKVLRISITNIALTAASGFVTTLYLAYLVR
jgi:hypothetical protein